MILAPFSFGVGDRFAHQAAAQLRAFQMLEQRGVVVAPTWNKSHREHQTIGSQPPAVRAAADAAVRELGWNHPYYVDADHIRLETVGEFIETSDFFTLDVADFIGAAVEDSQVEAFVNRHPELVGEISIAQH